MPRHDGAGCLRSPCGSKSSIVETTVRVGFVSQESRIGLTGRTRTQTTRDPHVANKQLSVLLRKVCCCAKRQLQRPSHFLPGSLVGTEDASPADAPLDTKQHLEGMNLIFRRISMRVWVTV